jgi:hypothetical protein
MTMIKLGAECHYTPEGCAEAKRLIRAYKIDVPLNKRDLDGFALVAYFNRCMSQLVEITL